MSAIQFAISKNTDNTFTYSMCGVPDCALTFDKVQNKIVYAKSPLIQNPECKLEYLDTETAFKMCPDGQKKYFMAMCAINYS